MKKNVLVTGVAGFIGSYVARRVQSEGYNVIGVDDLSQGVLANVPEGIDFFQGDLADLRTLETLPPCTYVLHLAGQSSGEVSFDDPVADLNKNVTSTLNLIRWSLGQKVKRFVYASSMSAYGPHEDAPAKESSLCQPLSCYGVGKLASEGYLKVYQKDLPFVALRMFNVYGPGQDLQNMRQGMVSIFVKMALTEGTVTVKGSLDRYRDFISVEDVAGVWTRSMMLASNESHILNVGTGVRSTVGNLLEAIKATCPDITWKSKGSTPGDQFGIYADTTRVKEVLGITAFKSLETGLRPFIEWAREKLQTPQTT